MECDESVGDYTDRALGERGRRSSIILYCELEDNIRRLALSGRGGSSNGKLTDVETSKEFRSTTSVHRFGDDNEIEIHVSSVAPEEAARKIKDFMDRWEGGGRRSEDEPCCYI